MFGFQKLDVYRLAVEFLSAAIPISESMPRGYASFGDQLRRAAMSISLNIAEGSGKFSQDAKRFYTIARGSALECAAIVDALKLIMPDNQTEFTRMHRLLDRVVAMLTKMIRS